MGVGVAGKTSLTPWEWLAVTPYIGVGVASKPPCWRVWGGIGVGDEIFLSIFDPHMFCGEKDMKLYDLEARSMFMLTYV